jgi:hypothetical protein
MLHHIPLAILLLLILLLIIAMLKASIPKLSSIGQRPRRKSGRSDCQPVSSDIYKRPDPFIYDQYYLMAQGIAVSWDNPDIRIELNDQPVDPHDLLPGRPMTSSHGSGTTRWMPRWHNSRFASRI